MISRIVRTLCIALALSVSLFGSSAAWAGPIGTQGLADIGTPAAGGSPTGNINTATSFTIGELISTGANTGVFNGMPTQVFGSDTFTLGANGSFSITSAVFGTFTSTSIVEASNVPGVVGIYVLGEYTPGSYVTGFGSGPFLASVTLSFTQTPAGAGGSISDSGTFSVPAAPPPSAAPEPASFVLLGLGAVGMVGYRRYRRARA